ncbi:hypothetical protein AAT19DRAFT_10258 [Rhodotorula toruloides]|uniref:Uncharacterized protein n=1 Tax=Rhodotorula toruloides TaxID=5286 RepID=A0A2T0A065_RHOTO|nr:hypothetical protein AAT19DRAFT_10258 [Rhodotorula toruloides]
MNAVSRITDRPSLARRPPRSPDSPRHRAPLLPAGTAAQSRTTNSLTEGHASHRHPTTPLPHSASPASLHPTLLDSLPPQTPSPRLVHGCVRSLLRTQGWISPSRLLSTRTGWVVGRQRREGSRDGAYTRSLAPRVALFFQGG